MSLLVLCPTRGRPAAAAEAYASFLDTRADGETEILFVIDDDERDAYVEQDLPLWRVKHAGGMVAALNAASADFLTGRPSVQGFIGDDHRFRTKGWDRTIAKHLRETGGGFAYGNDLAQGPNLPTAVFISTAIVRSLGYFALPTCGHLYVDNAWKTLGDEGGCMTYFPEIIIEHLHPVFGKGMWDAGYERVNDPVVYSRDLAAYRRWYNEDRMRDLGLVARALRR